MARGYEGAASVMCGFAASSMAAQPPPCGARPTLALPRRPTVPAHRGGPADAARSSYQAAAPGVFAPQVGLTP